MGWVLSNTMKDKRVVLFAVVIGVLHSILLSKISFFPYPEFFVYPYLTSKGFVPYKEILDQHFPGFMFFPVNFYSLGIREPADFRLVQYATVFISHLLLFFASLKIFKGGYLVFIPNILYFFYQTFLEGWVLWIDTLVTPLFLLAFLLLKKNNKSLFFAGLVLGIALLFKQTTVPLIFFLIIYFLGTGLPLKSIFYFLLGLLPTIGLLAFYILKLGILDDFWYWTVVFNLEVFAKLGRKAPTLPAVIQLLPLYFFSFVTILKIKRKENRLISLFFTALLAFVLARFDYVHLQPSLPFALLLFGIFLKNTSSKIKWIALLFQFLFILFLFVPKMHTLCCGKTLFFSEKEAIIADKVRNLSSENEKVFAFATLPHIYVLADRLPPGRLFVFQFPWYMSVAEQRVLSSLEKDQPVVVIRDLNAQVQGMKLIDYMGNIAKFINENYKVIDKIEEVEILIKK